MSSSSCNQALIALALAGCAIDAPETATSAQSVITNLEIDISRDFGCALDLDSETYAACLRSTYAMRCALAENASDFSCLGAQHMNDLSNEDLAAEIGFPVCDPAPKAVPGACWRLDNFGCDLIFSVIPDPSISCFRDVYFFRCDDDDGEDLDSVWCLGNQYLNDLSTEDILADLGLLDLEPNFDPPPPPPPWFWP